VPRSTWKVSARRQPIDEPPLESGEWRTLVLFAASLYLLKQDVASVSQGVEQRDIAAASKSVEAMR
jgi:hypothetical protein